MRKLILLALVLSICPVCLPTASPASDKKHNPESVLVSVEGCLKMSVAEYVIIDDTGTEHNLIGNTAKLRHYVGHRVQIVGEPTVKTIDTTQTTVASSVVEVPAIRVQSGRQIGGKCGR
ncbi:MAG: hypothetical protein ABSD98_16870 [Candidatus Korobacteraceae bacterium]|jgi:hypothetical protein